MRHIEINMFLHQRIYNCQENKCNGKYKFSLPEIVEHLKTIHNISIKVQSKTFNSYYGKLLYRLLWPEAALFIANNVCRY